MRGKTYLLVLTSSLVSTLSVLGQSAPNISDFTKIIEILPPSPNAASLGKYGGIDVGLSSGTPNISIPLYDYSSINIKMPISIFYSGSGVKVDEIASRV